MIPVGPFKLVSPIGRGGMGEVWAGVHLEHEMTVAVKVMTARKAQNQRYRKAFLREAQAVAGLDHPNIVRIYDYGEVTEEAAAMSEGRIAPETPYLAMEMVDGGTLSKRRGKMEWPELREVLFSLLDALAHAHARGVIHKDLKPGNVLLNEPGTGVKLTDFGLAHALYVEELTVDTPLHALGGTPAYMAPEQFEGDNRAMGPWTDLYSFGVMVWTLVRGQPPFGKKPWMTVARRHMNEDPPPLAPRSPMPEGFEEWLHLLMEKSPHKRVSRAADAAWALMQLREPPEAPIRKADQSDAWSLPSLGSSIGERTTLIWDSADELEQLPKLARLPEVADRSTLVPPMSTSWRRPVTPLVDGQLMGTGLGIYNARTPPIVDRDDERERLWRALREVRTKKRARMIAITGPAGVGKSRLAQWVSERAHELGAAIVFRASHSPIGTRRDGLPAMVARHLRCMGVTRQEAEFRIEQQLRAQGETDAEEWQALAQFVAPATRQDEDSGVVKRIRFASMDEQNAMVLRVLERATRERPVILWLDDVQWGIAALVFAQYLLDAKWARVPVLVVATSRDEALSERSMERLALAELLARRDVDEIPVGPLGTEDARTLVRQLLRFEPGLAARVEERIGGNPLFAVQLVGDWVSRGALELGESGFRLKPGADAHLPDDLHQAWSSTLERLLQGRPDEDGIALELAAVLGQHVDAGEWKEACRRVGVTPRPDLVYLLFSERLASTSSGPDEGWSFAQGMLRESLERRAREANRLQGHHGVCAALLRDRDPEAHRERVAWHLVAAGEVTDALPRLVESALETMMVGDHRRAGMLMSEWDRAMAALGAPPDDVRWGHGYVARARLARVRANYQDAAGWAEKAEDLARKLDDQPLLYRALRERGLVARMLGDLEAAWTFQREAEKLARNKQETADCLADQAWILVHRGRIGRARETFQRAIHLYRDAGVPEQAASCWHGLADSARKIGDLDKAVEWGDRARAAFEARGSRLGVADAINNRADVARLKGDLVAAEQGYRDALRRYDQLGVGHTSVAHLNLALALVERRDYRGARAQIDAFMDRLSDDQVNLRLMAHCALLPCTAWAAEWHAWDRYAERALATLEDMGFVDVDVAAMLHRAGKLAMDAGERERAVPVLRACRRQYASLRRVDEVAAVAFLLGPSG